MPGRALGHLRASTGGLDSGAAPGPRGGRRRCSAIVTLREGPRAFRGCRRAARRARAGLSRTPGSRPRTGRRPTVIARAGTRLHGRRAPRASAGASRRRGRRRSSRLPREPRRAAWGGLATTAGPRRARGPARGGTRRQEKARRSGLPTARPSACRSRTRRRNSRAGRAPRAPRARGRADRAPGGPRSPGAARAPRTTPRVPPARRTRRPRPAGQRPAPRCAAMRGFATAPPAGRRRARPPRRPRTGTLAAARPDRDRGCGGPASRTPPPSRDTGARARAAVRGRRRAASPGALLGGSSRNHHRAYPPRRLRPIRAWSPLLYGSPSSPETLSSVSWNRSPTRKDWMFRS